MAFIFGILGSFFASVLQGVAWIFYTDLFTLTTPLKTSILLSLFFLAATEEVARVLFSRQYLKNYAKKNFLTSALFFGIGFALLEVILTYWNGFSWSVFGASSFHILATYLAFWWLRENSQKSSTLILIVLLTLLHACFNLGILFFFNGS